MDYLLVWFLMCLFSFVCGFKHATRMIKCRLEQLSLSELRQMMGILRWEISSRKEAENVLP